MLRKLIDGLRLIWPITGGYRLLLPSLARRSWPAARPLAIIHRRLFVKRTCLIAVIGSLGKTTTRRMISHVLGGRRPRHSDSNYQAQLAANLLRVRPWHREAVLEVGIGGPGMMEPFARMLAPDIVVVTSISSDHHRAFPTLEDTRNEKVKMVQALPPDGLLIINGDDAHVRWMATQTGTRKVTYGLGPENDIRATDVKAEGLSGMRFTLTAGGRSCAASIQLLGVHMVYPALAAVAVALARGRPLDDIVQRLAEVAPSPQRLEPVRLSNGITLLRDDYKASIESIVAALETFRAIPATRHVLVLGAIEEPPSSVHALYRDLGARMAPWADRVILMGQDNLEGMIVGAARAGMDRAAFTRIGTSVHEVIALLRRELKAGDVVLIKGTGAQRLERVVLALQGYEVRCPAKQCKVKPFIRCVACPLLGREAPVFENVHLKWLAKL